MRPTLKKQFRSTLFMLLVILIVAFLFLMGIDASKKGIITLKSDLPYREVLLVSEESLEINLASTFPWILKANGEIVNSFSEKDILAAPKRMRYINHLTLEPGRHLLRLDEGVQLTMEVIGKKTATMFFTPFNWAVFILIEGILGWITVWRIQEIRKSEKPKPKENSQD